MTGLVKLRCSVATDCRGRLRAVHVAQAGAAGSGTSPQKREIQWPQPEQTSIHKSSQGSIISSALRVGRGRCLAWQRNIQHENIDPTSQIDWQMRFDCSLKL